MAAYKLACITKLLKNQQLFYIKLAAIKMVVKRDEILNNFSAAAIVGTYERCIQLIFRSFQQLACVSLPFTLLDGS